MSGVYIKGMEMPKSCDICWALDDYGDYPRCRITEEQRGYNFTVREKRMDGCPLVPVPPHGRLIDKDATVVFYDSDGNEVEVGTITYTRKQTNADKIRRMTDEELAEFIETLAPSGTYQFFLNGKTWGDWLKQEVIE